MSDKKETALVPANQASGMQIFDQTQLKAMVEVAQYFHKSGAVPAVFKNEGQVLMALQAGVELGIPPVEALGCLYIVNGSIRLWGSAVGGRLAKFGFKIEWLEATEQRATCKITDPRDGRSHTESYTWQEAAKAGLTGKDPWQKYPRNMLRYKAQANGIRFFCPQVLSGYYMVEESDDWTGGEVIGDVKPSSADRLRENAGNVAEMLKQTAETKQATGAEVIEEKSETDKIDVNSLTERLTVAFKSLKISKSIDKLALLSELSDGKIQKLADIYADPQVTLQTVEKLEERVAIIKEHGKKAAPVAQEAVSPPLPANETPKPENATTGQGNGKLTEEDVEKLVERMNAAFLSLNITPDEKKAWIAAITEGECKSFMNLYDNPPAAVKCATTLEALVELQGRVNALEPKVEGRSEMWRSVSDDNCTSAAGFLEFPDLIGETLEKTRQMCEDAGVKYPK